VKNKKRTSALTIIRAAFRLAWLSSRNELIIVGGISMLSSILIVTMIALQKTIIDSVESFLELNSLIYVPILFILLRFFVLIANDVLAAIKSYTIRRYSMTFEHDLIEKCVKKAAKIDVLNYEDSELYKRIEKAREGGESVSKASLTLITLFTSIFSAVVGVAGYLIYINPVLAFLLLFSLAPSLVVRIYLSKIRAGMIDETAGSKRALAYFARCIISKEYFKETRVLGAFGLFKSLWDTSRSEIDKKEWKFHSKNLALTTLELSCFYIGYAASFLLAAYSLYTGAISVGSFAAVLAALTYVQSTVNAVVSNLGEIYENGALANHYFNFLELPERPRGAKSKPRECAIELRDVSFRYPCSKRFALTKISLVIPANETLAIVGANGAGKTTLAKIVAGLFSPQEGEVIYGGVRRDEIQPEQINADTSAIFQDFGKYNMTVRENVSLSTSRSANNEKTVIHCLTRAGFDLSKAEYQKDGIDTLIGPEYGGVDLSGGEWQMIALARSSFRDHTIIILDEPTSNIDPIREADIYRKFIEASQDKTALIVTHRLGAATLADRIILLDSGRLAETGSHDELITMKGLYASMFEAQAKWYFSDGDIVHE
jgi:ATP-binding cassette, subfamily B, bacterial